MSDCDCGSCDCGSCDCGSCDCGDCDCGDCDCCGDGDCGGCDCCGDCDCCTCDCRCDNFCTPFTSYMWGRLCSDICECLCYCCMDSATSNSSGGGAKRDTTVVPMIPAQQSTAVLTQGPVVTQPTVRKQPNDVIPSAPKDEMQEELAAGNAVNHLPPSYDEALATSYPKPTYV